MDAVELLPLIGKIVAAILLLSTLSVVSACMLSSWISREEEDA